MLYRMQYEWHASAYEGDIWLADDEIYNIDNTGSTLQAEYTCSQKHYNSHFILDSVDVRWTFNGFTLVS